MFDWLKSGNRHTDMGIPKPIVDPTFRCSYGYLEWLIKDHSGYDISFHACWEIGNDVDKEIDVAARQPDNEWDKKTLEEYQASGKQGGYSLPGLALDWMCRIGKLAPGNYIIDMSW